MALAMLKSVSRGPWQYDELIDALILTLVPDAKSSSRKEIDTGEEDDTAVNGDADKASGVMR